MSSKQEIYWKAKHIATITKSLNKLPEYIGASIAQLKKFIKTQQEVLNETPKEIIQARELKLKNKNELWAIYKAQKLPKVNYKKISKGEILKALKNQIPNRDDILLLSNSNAGYSRKIESLNNIFRNPNFDLLTIKKEIENLFLSIMGKKYLLSFTIDGEEYHRTIGNNYLKLCSWLLNDIGVENENLVGSNKMDNLTFSQVENLRIEEIKEPTKSLRDQIGNFFQYYNTTDIDLSHEFIYTREQFLNTPIIENCFISVLINSKLFSESEINAIKLKFPSYTFNKKYIKDISEEYGIKFIMSEVVNNIIATRTIGKGDKSIKLSLFKEHYFISRDIECTLFYIKNYNEISNTVKEGHPQYENRYSIFRSRPRPDGSGCDYRVKKELHNNLKIINEMFKKGLLVQDGCILTSNNFRVETDVIMLDNISKEQELNILPDPNSVQLNKFGLEIRTYIFYADFESQTTNPDGTTCPHIPIMCSYMSDADKDALVSTTRPMRDMLNYITKRHTYFEGDRIIVYFHNLKYDWSLMKKELESIFGICRKDGMLYNIRLNWYGKNLQFRDSYKIIPEKLKNMPKMFNLPEKYHKNEAINYSYYNKDNINNMENIPIEDYLKTLDPSLHKTFHEIIESGTVYCNYDKKNKTFIPLLYYKDYAKLDTEILRLSMRRLNDEFKILSEGKSIFDYLTISSMALGIISPSIIDVHRVKGNLRKYMSNCIHGGRVSVNPKYCKKVINETLSDFDECSQYPSAMIRFSRDYGFPTGKWENISNFENTLEDKTKYYVIKIKLTEIGKKIQIPVVCVKRDGVSNYINELPNNEPIEISVDRISLEDMIKFQKIKYEFIDGVQVSLINSSSKLGDKIKELYLERLRIKKSNPPMGNLLKLVMNASYGKQASKITNTTEVIVKNNLLNNYIYKNYHNINVIEKISEYNSILEIFQPDGSFAYTPNGVMILSMSKRMMNEIFNICDENKYPIYYTDTDSMQLRKKDIPLIAGIYKDKYGVELIGEMTEQFHSDFKLNGSDGKPINPEHVISTKAIFLGKKCYINKLEGIDSKGVKCYGLHYRMKGIPDKALINHCNIKYGGDIFKCYENLANDNEEVIVLNYNEHNPRFEFTSTGVQFRELGSFKRTISFKK
jgi:hypothetical protein